MAKNRARFNVRTVQFSEYLKEYANFKISLKPRNDDIISLLPDDVSDSTFMDAFSKKNSELTGTKFVSLCQKCVKRKNISSHVWWLIYDRLKEIKSTVTLVDLVYIFHLYCNSESFDINFVNFIDFFWDLLEGKIKKLPFLTLLYVYDCAEKTKNIQKLKEVKDTLFHYLNNVQWNRLQLSEDKLLILLKMICKSKRNINSRCKKKICEEIKSIHFQDVKGIISCIHFFLKYSIYDDTFNSLLNKAQFFLIFNNNNNSENSNLESNVKNFNDALKFNDPFVLREITRTLYVIYASYKKNFCLQ